MAITLDAIVLPDDLDWQDEFDWAPVAQTITPTLTGAIIVEENGIPEGRKITLVSDGGAWATRGLVRQLKEKEAVLNTPMTLTLNDGRAFTVIWRRDPVGVEAKQVMRIADPDDSDFYEITLRFTVVNS